MSGDAHVRNGSWLCENAKTLNRDRRSYSSKTALVAQGASGLHLEVGLENIILRCVSIFEFLHSQGHLQTFSVGQTGSALSLEADVVNRSAMSPKGKSRHHSINSVACLTSALGILMPTGVNEAIDPPPCPAATKLTRVFARRAR